MRNLRKFTVMIASFALVAMIKTTKADQLPADPQALPGVEDLLKRMEKLLEDGIMFGHQDDTIYGHQWKYKGESDVKRTVGDYPAVFGWEIGSLEIGKKKSLDGVHFSRIRNGMIWAHGQRGINTISWHGANVVTNGNTWDTSSKEVVKSALPGGKKSKQYQKQLDRLAKFFLSVKTKDGKLVPMIFRPYHEHTGSWFWWGQNLCSTEDYIALWRYTVDYLRSKGVHNLLYAYSAAGNFPTKEAYLERYPGDDLIDIIGFDTYQRGVDGKERYISGLTKGLDILMDVSSEKKKMAILAESGFEGVPDPEWWTETLWSSIKDYPISYALFWRNAYHDPNHYYVPYPGQVSETDFKEFEKIDETLFLQDIQN